MISNCTISIQNGDTLQAAHVACINTLLPLIGKSLEFLEINIQSMMNMGESSGSSFGRDNTQFCGRTRAIIACPSYPSTPLCNQVLRWPVDKSATYTQMPFDSEVESIWRVHYRPSAFSNRCPISKKRRFGTWTSRNLVWLYWYGLWTSRSCIPTGTVRRNDIGGRKSILGELFW